MNWWIGFIVGLFTGLIFGYFLLRAKIDNIERYEEELAEYFKEVVKALKKKYEPSTPLEDVTVKDFPLKKNRNDDVKAALLALKYSASEADKAMAGLPEGLSVEDSVKRALQYFNKGG
jgi:selenocysteine lyase/cysteine desulfurase